MTERPDPAAFAAAAPAAEDALPADLAFAPVPIKPTRFGWSAARQRIFIRALAETACVSEASAAAGVSPRSAYRLRLRPGAESFDRAWRQALVLGSHRLTTIAFERAIHGRARPIRHKGEVIGEEFVPSDRLLIYLLEHFDRARFGDLAGFLPYNVPDPIGAAAGAIPALLDSFVDQPTPADADQHETFDLLPEDTE